TRSRASGRAPAEAAHPPTRRGPRQLFPLPARASLASGGQNRMIQAPGSVLKSGRDVLTLQIGEVREDLLRRLPFGEPLEHIDDAHTHAADAGAAATLVGIDGDAVEQLSHGGLRDVSRWPNLS